MKITNEEIYKQYKQGYSCFEIMLQNRINYDQVCSALTKVGGKDFILPKCPRGKIRSISKWIERIMWEGK